MLERSARYFALALIFVSFALTGCDKVGSAAGGKAPAGVVAPTALYATIANGKVDIEGGVIEVAARRPGVISEVLAQEGDVVTKGQVLARLEGPGCRPRHQQREGRRGSGAQRAQAE